jgi:DNA repair photolyase
VFTHALYACSPYRGCGHGCLYCDGRAERYYVEGDFERDIAKRDWLPDTLTRELAGLREWGALALGSGVTDVYQPCERSEGLTRRTLEAIAAMPDRTAEGGIAPLPVVVLTKSALILRDLDLWRRIHERAAVLVLVSITTLDDGVRRVFEPGASPVEERLEILRVCRANGFHTGALVMPLLPGISDGAESIGALLKRLAEVGVDFAMVGGLTLRPGRQKETFLEALDQAFPELGPLYGRLYGENRESGSPRFAYRAEVERRAGSLLAACGLAWLLPHRIVRHLLAPHDELCVLLWQMGELYGRRHVDTRRLREAAARWAAWLKGVRTELRRRRSLPAVWLGERVTAALDSGELVRILDNDKLARFAGRVLKGAVFDHQTLALREP